MPHTFPTSPGASGEQRKFVNPTSGYVGANVFGPDGKPTAIPVEPGGEVWLTSAEERMTAEAPRHAEDNPFIKRWDEPVEWDQFGEPTRTVPRSGTLCLADEAPRPIASDRFIPARAEASPDPEPEITGAPPLPEQPPVEGQPSPDEIVATPEAVAANDETLSKRASTKEQPTKSAAISV